MLMKGMREEALVANDLKTELSMVGVALNGFYSTRRCDCHHPSSDHTWQNLSLYPLMHTNHLPEHK